jgi:peptidoglycan hydrolase CwlO-like protein
VSATDDSKVLRAILEKLDGLEKGQKSTNGRLDGLETKIDGLETKIDGLEKGQAETNIRLSNLEEDSKITRNGVNLLLDWAEKAQVQVQIPLFKKGGD